MKAEDINKIRGKLYDDIIKVDVKYNVFCTYITTQRDNNPNRADKLISEATTQYNTIQHLYNQITDLINKIIIEEEYEF
jgi:hypothetical protein